MKSPIRFNCNFIPSCLKNYLPVAYDIRDILKRGFTDRKTFSRYMTSIYDGRAIYKSTQPERHFESNTVIKKKIKGKDKVKILDVGVSDGSTSLDLIELLDYNFEKYYVTDISFKIFALEKNKNITFFYDYYSKKCLFKVTNRFIIYNDYNANIFPLNILAKNIISKAPEFEEKKTKEVNLCQPDLLNLVTSNRKIILKEWDIFKQWEEDNVDIVKIANVLNKVYFSDATILQALKNVKNIMNENGLLLLVDNRKLENWTLFKLEKTKFIEEMAGNYGTEIRELVLST